MKGLRGISYILPVKAVLPFVSIIGPKPKWQIRGWWRDPDQKKSNINGCCALTNSGRGIQMDWLNFGYINDLQSNWREGRVEWILLGGECVFIINMLNPPNPILQQRKNNWLPRAIRFIARYGVRLNESNLGSPASKLRIQLSGIALFRRQVWG